VAGFGVICRERGGNLSANVTTLLAAVVAVLGTITSPVLTQRYTNRARLQEIEAARRQRLEDRDEAQRTTSLLERRASYTTLHTASWDFRRALKNCLFDAHALEELEIARQAFLSSYRNSQMIAADAVLKAAAPVYNALTRTYGRVKRLTAETFDSHGDRLKGDEHAVIQAALNSQVEDAIRQLRMAMREDLGVAGSHAPPEIVSDEDVW
jgi:hypothetical protein